MASTPTFTLDQKIFPKHKGEITVRFVHMNDLSQRDLDRFLSTVVEGKIGVAPAYGAKQVLAFIAFASLNQVLLLKLSKNPNSTVAAQKCELLGTRIFMNSDYIKFAFHMDKLCTSLFHDLSLYITGAVDILSSSPHERHLLLTKAEVLGGEPTVNARAVKGLFCDEESAKVERSIIAAQAWAAYQASLLRPLSSRALIDTRVHSVEEMTFLAKTIRDAEQLRALQPTTASNDIEDDYKVNKGQLQARCARFGTRIKMPSSNQQIRIEFSTPNGTKVQYRKNLSYLDGRSVGLNLTSGASSAKNVKLSTVGRDDPTSADTLRTNILLNVLQNRSNLLTIPFVKEIWFPQEARRPSTATFAMPVPVAFNNPKKPLNHSQEEAVMAILSNKPKHRLVLIQGPPGTGKTTVIAAAVVSIIACGDKARTVWLAAQSNVAVKNIAEKLADEGFLDFRLLVSKDFHYDWHEELYEEIIPNVIRSDDFPSDRVVTERLLRGSRVILCTLSMLSNDRISCFTRLVPPSLFIFDEASQIEVGSYIPVLYRYQRTMRKLVFIGDDKQLPPFGQNDIATLESVFELPHLRSQAFFLDTQYRMPIAIGNVISQRVYNGLLKSVHPITSKLGCRFINVTNGREQRRGKSWVNEEQNRIAVSIAGKLAKLGFSYRLISPYDAQRTLMENSLKQASLDWGDKVFNVDSFQGNEADYIIICVVRTQRIGFLQDLRRVNVMLTRCKKGMIICTDKNFLQNVAPKSLVAALANAVGGDAWVHWKAALQPGFHPFPTVH
ncbi:ATP-dependent helicase upf1 [Leucoagaricus sp. SymC.cos]|nr:ATP-dependent helicase upf1 [Leucoagaricus sp. SymC.cos]